MQDFFKGYNVPEELKRRVLLVMKRFTINGICDGMYIANVIAYEEGFGNGESTFYDEIQNVSLSTAERLAYAYSHHIQKDEVNELFNILNTGEIDKSLAVVGIKRFIHRFKDEIQREISEWGRESSRLDYLRNSIAMAKNTMVELM